MGACSGDDKPALDKQHEQADHSQRAGQTKLFADSRDHEVGVHGWDVPRRAEVQACPEDST